MYTHKQNWLEQVIASNDGFRAQIDADKLPFQRTPGETAIITCMDPRINLEALGIPQFLSNGKGTSAVRIIRTIGGMAEERSLVVGIFLAGIREIAVLMHDDCGCSLAYAKIDTILERMQEALADSELEQFKARIGEPFRENLRDWLKAFEDPYAAVRHEVESIRSMPFIPRTLIVHGLVYELKSGKINVVVNGYK